LISAVPIENLVNEPYASILCYPRAEPLEAESRILELKELGIAALEFSGYGTVLIMPKMLPVLGKGFAGVVVVAYNGTEHLALKMRRHDSNRDSFYHEAEMLQKANEAGVGPAFKAVTKNFLLSQLIDGGLLTTWLISHKKKTAVRRVVEDILEQCWRLDAAGINHGELSHACRHILMDKKENPYIVDFEAASIRRGASNVTAVGQYLFVGNSATQKMIREVLVEKDTNHFIDALKNYKKERTRSRFEALLKLAGV